MFGSCLNGGDVVALLPTGFGKSLLFINCYRSSARNWGGQSLARRWLCPLWLPTWTIGLRRCAVCCTAWRALWSRSHGGEFQPYFWYPRILDSQSKMASYGINPIPWQPGCHCRWRGTCRIQMVSLVINFNELIYVQLSSVQGSWALHNIRHNQTLCDWLTSTPMILNFRQAPHEKVNTFQLCPSRLCLLRSKAR